MQATEICDADAREAHDYLYRTICSDKEYHVPHSIYLATSYRKMSEDELIDTVNS